MQRGMTSVMPEGLLARLEAADEGSPGGSPKPQDGDQVGLDGSAAGPLAGRVHRCEGALDAVAMLEANAAPWMEVAANGPMLVAMQSRTMLAMREARAADSLHDLAKEKLDDVDGRLSAGTRLYASLTAAADGGTGATGMSATNAPKHILRAALSQHTSQLAAAEAELESAKMVLELAESAHAKVNHAMGRVVVLRSVASRAAYEQRAYLHHERRRLLGEMIGSRMVYAKLKSLLAARDAAKEAVAHGVRMLEAEEAYNNELSAAKVTVTITGTAQRNAAGLQKSRLNQPTLELLLGELTKRIAKLSEEEGRRFTVTGLSNGQVPKMLNWLASKENNDHIHT